MNNKKYISKISKDGDLLYIKDSEVGAWAKQESKPSYTSSEIGLGNVTNDAQVKRTEMGVASGVATLDSNGKIPSSQLPSYVDDVIECYYYNNKFYATYTPGEEGQEVTYSDEITPEQGKIYVDIPTNQSYRWSGSTYIVISSPYILPTASANVLGGIKVGTNLSIDNNGVLSAAGAAYTAGDGIDITSNEISVDTTVCRIGGTDSQQALNAPDIVNNVAYNSSTGKLTMVKNSVSSDIVEIVTSGFQLITNENTGADVFTAVGTATIINDTTTGADVFTF